MFDRPVVERPELKSRAVVAAEQVVAGATATANVGMRLPYLIGFVVCGFFTLLWGFAALASIAFSPPTGVGVGLMTLAVGWGAKRNWDKLTGRQKPR